MTLGHQFRNVVHLSESETPPHLVNHPFYSDDEGPWRPTSSSSNPSSPAMTAKHLDPVEDHMHFHNDVVFASDASDLKEINKWMDYESNGPRPFVHRYSVPSRLLSPELFGDDDITPDGIDASGMNTHQTKTLWLAGDQPELWQTVQARRRDAIKNNRVVRFVNAVETPGKTSFILPKSLIRNVPKRFYERRKPSLLESRVFFEGTDKLDT